MPEQLYISAIVVLAILLALAVARPVRVVEVEKKASKKRRKPNGPVDLDRELAALIRQIEMRNGKAGSVRAMLLIAGQRPIEDWQGEDGNIYFNFADVIEAWRIQEEVRRYEEVYQNGKNGNVEQPFTDAGVQVG